MLQKFMISCHLSVITHDSQNWHHYTTLIRAATAVCLFSNITSISRIKKNKLEGPQMSYFPDGHNHDATITVLITTRRKRGVEEAI